MRGWVAHIYICKIICQGCERLFDVLNEGVGCAICFDLLLGDVLEGRCSICLTPANSFLISSWKLTLILPSLDPNQTTVY